MTTYSAIANSEVDADSPVTATLMQRLRDNPLAIQEGDATAPDLAWAAIQPALADMVHDELGAIVFARVQTDTGTTYTPGDTVAGSALRTGSMYDDSASGLALNFNATALTGTWQALCDIPADSTGTGDGLGLWVRVA